MIAMPSASINHDDVYCSDALTFDGYRFHHARANEHQGDGRSDNEYSEIKPGNLPWGHGRFTYPGRWYASLTIKLLLASLIVEYDIGFPEETANRPSKSVIDVHVFPDMKQEMLLTNR